MRDRFDLALGNDADADRHGIVTPRAGLMNPNHFLSAAVAYLFGGGRDWAAGAAVGKTLVSSSDDRPRRRASDDRCSRCPVGFKWFVDGLLDGRSASAARRAPGPRSCAGTATVWTTDKDGIIACLLAAEMTARTGPRSRPRPYDELTDRFGAPATAASTRRPRPSRRRRSARLCRDASHGRRSSPASRSPQS